MKYFLDLAMYSMHIQIQEQTKPNNGIS